MGVINLTRQIRWIWVLPISMVGLTALLILLNARQEAEFWAAHRGFTDTPWEIQQPARLFAILLTGPGFLLSFWMPGIYVSGKYYEVGRLLGVAFFWAGIGWLLDRRLRGLRTPVIPPRWIRALLYSGLLTFSITVIWALLSGLQSQEMLPAPLLWRILEVFGLRASVLNQYADLCWAVVGVVYFGSKLVTTVRNNPQIDKKALLR